MAVSKELSKYRRDLLVVHEGRTSKKYTFFDGKENENHELGTGFFVHWSVLDVRSCRGHSQYIYSLMMFVVKNREILDSNKAHCEINTRHIMDLHMHQVNLAVYGKEVYPMAVRIYNALPNTLKVISEDIKKFKNKLKEFLYFNSFYTLEEFFRR
jgi:hypothetical protein